MPNAHVQTNSDQRIDRYPSRVATVSEVIERQDPVLYRHWSKGAPLSRSDCEYYQSNGFVFLEEFFESDEVAVLQAETARLAQDTTVVGRDEAITEPGSRAVRSIFDIHDLSPVFSTFAKGARMADIARFLLDDDVYLHQSRLNYKPGFRGKEFYWHSDFETWHVEDGMPRMRAVSMSITLSENNEFNGPLILIPASHYSYLTCVGRTPEDHYKQSLKKQDYGIPDDDSLANLVSRGGLVAPKGGPGSLIIFDCNTMHGSNGNISPFPRRNAFFVYNALSNRLAPPYAGTKPRPDFIAHRDPSPFPSND